MAHLDEEDHARLVSDFVPAARAAALEAVESVTGDMVYAALQRSLSNGAGQLIRRQVDEAVRPLRTAITGNADDPDRIVEQRGLSQIVMDVRTSQDRHADVIRALVDRIEALEGRREREAAAAAKRSKVEQDAAERRNRVLIAAITSSVGIAAPAITILVTRLLGA